MSRPQYGNNMDRPSTSDIIRRARERAEAGGPREDYETFLRRQAAMNNANNGSPSTPDIPPRNRPPQGSPDSGVRQQRLQAPRGLQDKNGQITLPISRPAPVPQWPLAGPLNDPPPANTEPYRPPVGSSPPQRPPRPSNVPSLLDASKIQDPMPSFQYIPHRDSMPVRDSMLSRDSIPVRDSIPSRDSENATSSVPETPSTLSRPSTLSSVGSIPDFPLPIQAPSPAMPPPRRSVTLGPPPSARRGASSFYSHLSYVSPIPEESPRSRSHTSYASSAAMPESWGEPSPMSTPRNPEAFFDDRFIEDPTPSPSEDMSMQSMAEEDGDESRLVRNASVGRRGKAALVTTAPTTRDPDAEGVSPRPGAAPIQTSPFSDGTGLLEASSNSSSTVPSANSGSRVTWVGTAATADNVRNAASTRASRRMSTSVPAQDESSYSLRFSRLSAIRRPPKLDIDAVRQAESRGSMTSLPDLIRRATRLAASLERGRRPASRFDLDDFPSEPYAANNVPRNTQHDSDEYFDDKHRSGLSDMLAAFPPPAQAQSRTGVRQSVRDSVLSWPLPPLNRNSGAGLPGYSPEGTMPESQKKGRRCCGLPLWGFVLIVIVLVILVAAAVIIPIEFFVIRRDGNNSNTNTTAAAEQQCQNQLVCKNGGSNVVTNGICSCICTNGFTGFDCSTSDTAGCTTTTIAGDANISNVTLGDALPRLLTQASSNFSITLSEKSVLSKLNAGNLSCSSQNALVTFNGQNTRLAAAANVVLDGTTGSTANLAIQGNALAKVNEATVTVMAGTSTTVTLTIGGGVTSIPPTTTVTITRTFTSDWTPSSTSATTTTTISTTVTSAAPSATTSTTSTFTVTPEALDFARVGVLFILQQEQLNAATTAQTALSTFFQSSTAAQTLTAASNISLANGNTIDLVNFHIDTGTGLVGSKAATVKRDLSDPGTSLWERGPAARLKRKPQWEMTGQGHGAI